MIALGEKPVLVSYALAAILGRQTRWCAVLRCVLVSGTGSTRLCSLSHLSSVEPERTVARELLESCTTAGRSSTLSARKHAAQMDHYAMRRDTR